MRKWDLDHPRLWIVVSAAALLTLLPLAWLQYRWIGAISRAEWERRQAHLSASLGRFAQEFDGEINRLFRALLAGAGVPEAGFDELASRYGRLADAGVDPRLVKNLYASRGGAEGAGDLFRFDPGAARFVPIPWPAELQPLRARLLPPARAPGPGWLALFDPLDERTMTLVGPPRRRPFRPDADGRFVWSFAQLDRDFISREFLPGLARRHLLGEGEPELAVLIVAARDPRQIIYASQPTLPAAFFSQPDRSVPLLDVRIGPQFPGAPRRLPPIGVEPGPPGAWRVLVKHRAGSLENAVAQGRRRNLILSFAVLMLLAAGFAVLLVSTRRAQRLARLQMEFVAGVSHELRTPLSVICSAGDNLADGLVGSEPQVRRYGSVIRNEGRRLSRMVEQILGFAGVQSGRARLELQPVDVAELIARVTAACEPEVRAAGCEVESALDAGLPPVLADPTALSHCLRNVVENAARHGGQGGWIGIRGRYVPDGRAGRVEIAVEDRGRGIHASELPRIFDPFYRGRRAVEDQTPGFGLGLALARRILEAHAGLLEVESVPGKGTRFVARIPAAPLAEVNGSKDPAGRG